MFYEALDELERDEEGYATPIDETREWRMEEIAMVRWFRENPRYIDVNIFRGIKLIGDSVQILEGAVPEKAKLEVVFDDWPDYVDDIDD